MPRGARLEAPEALHHVVVRGIERSRLCHDDRDRADFIARLAGVVGRTGLAVLAWALLPNHLHLLVRTPAALVARALAVTPAVVRWGVERGPAVLPTRQIGVEDAGRAAGGCAESPPSCARPF